MPFDNPCQMPFGDVELLMDARTRISNCGMWVKGRFRDGDRYCLVAALSVACASRSFKVPSPTERRLARLLAAQLPPTARFWTRLRFIPARHRLMSFNDDRRTRHEDVIALLDRAIHCLAGKMSVDIVA
jgi:hypothetical protein